MSEVDALFGVLHQSTGADVAAAFEQAIREAPDRLLYSMRPIFST